MVELFETHLNKLKRLKPIPVRDSSNLIEWNDRLIGIKGARGVGKTTLLMQKLKEMNLPPEKALYVSLDDLWFSKNRLIDLARDFVQRGGTHLFFDEVHKYATWSQEIKNCYDIWDELHIVFTGSSMLHIHNSRADLSRRAMMYHLRGFSFREYLNTKLKLDLKPITLDEILKNHTELATKICENLKPLPEFSEYLIKGYYPYHLEYKSNYLERLKETILYVLEVDLVQLRNISPQHINQLKKLVYVLSQSVPFKPNMVKLAETVGVARNTLSSYLNYLEEAEIITQIYSEGKGDKILQKPDKLYLENPNLFHALSRAEANIGAVRETFFVNQVGAKFRVQYAGEGDFLVDENVVFEVGGRNKTFKQIANLPNSYLAVDDIEFGVGNRIPLWLFGFMY